VPQVVNSRTQDLHRLVDSRVFLVDRGPRALDSWLPDAVMEAVALNGSPGNVEEDPFVLVIERVRHGLGDIDSSNRFLGFFGGPISYPMLMGMETGQSLSALTS
jgi:hypothetical protein